jgi:hypothetical protein
LHMRHAIINRKFIAIALLLQHAEHLDQSPFQMWILRDRSKSTKVWHFTINLYLGTLRTCLKVDTFFNET